MILRNPDDSDFNGTILGSIKATMTYGEESINGWINVMSHLSKPLLSWSHAHALRILPKDYPQQLPESTVRGNVKHVKQSNSLLEPLMSSIPEKPLP